MAERSTIFVHLREIRQVRHGHALYHLPQSSSFVHLLEIGQAAQPDRLARLTKAAHARAYDHAITQL